MPSEITIPQPKNEVSASKDKKPSTHQYHAIAHALSGHLRHPVSQTIKEQAQVTIEGERGGHVTEQLRAFNLEGVLTFEKAHSRVSGSRSPKNSAWITLSTSIVEGLNVFEVITADRVVSQVSTEHAHEDGHVPDVTFLGTKFVNLRLSGFEIKPKFRFGICGTKPAGMTAYVRDPEFLARAKAQLARVEKELSALIDDVSNSQTKQQKPDIDDKQDRVLLQRHRALLQEAHDRYSKKLRAVEDVENPPKPSGGIAADTGGNGRSADKMTAVTCSLIDEIENIEELQKAIPGLRAAGHVLFIPEFGIVALGEIDVSSNSEHNDNYFTLKMLDMDLGCVGDGKVTTALAAANGRHNP
jgi:hypothetical protein